VFSPYYAAARRRGAGDPRNHVAVNVALYGGAERRWSMTERNSAALTASSDHLQIGPSAARWDDDGLTIRLDEVAVPMPRRIRGTVRLMPSQVTGQCFTLDPAGCHRWWPIAPHARVEVALETPALTWSGDGYFDSNEGSEPLEAGFARWTWLRAHLADRSTALLFEPLCRDGTQELTALTVARDGAIAPFQAPERAVLPGTLWGISRETRATGEGTAKVVATLEDTPFYARSQVSLDLLEPAVPAMHESLSLDRFDSRWVQLLLPFRMPRRAR